MVGINGPSANVLVLVAKFLILGMMVGGGQAFTVRIRSTVVGVVRNGGETAVFLSNPSDDEDSATDPDGADLAAQLFQMAQSKGVSLNADDLYEDEEEDEEDDEEDDEDDDEEEVNFPQGAINAFLGYDTGDVGERLAGNVSLTNDQLYSEVKERVLDTAGGFVDFVRRASDDDEDEDEMMDGPKVYIPPITVPDSDLTAGEVVLLVLEALQNNDNPTKNAGVKILFGYSSSGSQIKNEEGLTPDEYADFLKEAEYNVLFTHQEVVRFLMPRTISTPPPLLVATTQNTHHSCLRLER
jgi:hypothetical protein